MEAWARHRPRKTGAAFRRTATHQSSFDASASDNKGRGYPHLPALVPRARDCRKQQFESAYWCVRRGFRTWGALFFAIPAE